MKKILVFMLVVLSCVSMLLVSCGGGGGDSTLADINKAFADAAAFDAEAVIIYKNADGTVFDEIETTLSQDGGVDDDGVALDKLTVPYFNYFEIDGSDVVIPEDFDDSFNASTTKSATIILSRLNFNAKYFKGGKYTYEKNTLKTTVTNCKGFFGIDLHAREVNVSVSMSSVLIRKVNLTYTTDMGYQVEINITFHN